MAPLGDGNSPLRRGGQRSWTGWSFFSFFVFALFPSTEGWTAKLDGVVFSFLFLLFLFLIFSSLFLFFSFSHQSSAFSLSFWGGQRSWTWNSPLLKGWTAKLDVEFPSTEGCRKAAGWFNFEC